MEILLKMALFFGESILSADFFYKRRVSLACQEYHPVDTGYGDWRRFFSKF
jgi:hypothetical protein